MRISLPATSQESPLRRNRFIQSSPSSGTEKVPVHLPPCRNMKVRANSGAQRAHGKIRKALRHAGRNYQSYYKEMGALPHRMKGQRKTVRQEKRGGGKKEQVS